MHGDAPPGTARPRIPRTAPPLDLSEVGGSAAGRSFDRVALRAHLPISSAARTLGEALARARIASLHLGLGEYAYAEDFLAVAAGIARNAAFQYSLAERRLLSAHLSAIFLAASDRSAPWLTRARGGAQELELGDCACVETPGPVARERALRAAFAAVGASGPSLIRLEGGPHPLPAALAALAPHLLSIDVGRSQLPAACLADLAAALPAAPRLRRLAAHFLSWRLF
eukprot:tig00000325_g24090.t1